MLTTTGIHQETRSLIANIAATLCRITDGSTRSKAGTLFALRTGSSLGLMVRLTHASPIFLKKATMQQNKMKDIHHRHTDNVICPYCGANNGQGYGDGPPKPKGMVECENCGKNFNCEPECSVIFSTSKAPCANGEPHDFIKPYYPWGDHRGFISCRYCSKEERFGDWQGEKRDDMPSL